MPGARAGRISNRSSQLAMLTVVSEEQIDLLLWQSPQVSHPVSVLPSPAIVEPVIQVPKDIIFHPRD